MIEKAEVGKVRRIPLLPELRSIDEKARTIEFVASTETVDRYGDVIRVGGWKFDNYLKNPVFLWGHRSGDPPIGKTVELKIETNPPALVHRVQFADASVYPFAETIFRLYENGYMRAVSVGFKPLEQPKPITDEHTGRMTGWEFTSQELLELSAVPIPANPEAVARAIKAGDLAEADARKLFAFDEEKLAERELAGGIFALLPKVEALVKRLETETRAALRAWTSVEPELREVVSSPAKLRAAVNKLELEVAGLEAETALRSGGKISSLDELLGALVEK